MRIVSTLGFGLGIFFGLSLIASADLQPLPPEATNLIIKTDNIFDPDHISLASLQTYEKKFDFDWNNYVTIERNRKRITEIEMFLKTTKPKAFEKLNDQDKQALGRILYRLGTFYTHIMHAPDIAIERLDLADKFLQNKSDRAWNYNHLGYAYEQKFATSGQDNDRSKALYYTNKVIFGLYPNGKNKEVAFAYCIEGLVDNDMTTLHLEEAENSFQNALKIYEKLPNGQDDQYARAKNRLAMIILDRNRDNEAITMFEELKKYWLAKKDVTQNPYAARNFVSLGQAYLKVGKAKDARDEIQKAVSIYQNVYGNKSQWLIKPYQLLAEAYKLLGDQKLSETYQQKADELNKAKS